MPRLTAVDGVDTAVGRRGRFANPVPRHVRGGTARRGMCRLLLRAGASGRGRRLGDARDRASTSATPASTRRRAPVCLDCAAAARLATGSRQPPRWWRRRALRCRRGRGGRAPRRRRSGRRRAAARWSGCSTARRRLGPRLVPADARHDFFPTWCPRADPGARAPGGGQARRSARLAGVELTTSLPCPGDDSLGTRSAGWATCSSAWRRGRAARLVPDDFARRLALDRAGVASDRPSTRRSPRAPRARRPPDSMFASPGGVRCSPTSATRHPDARAECSARASNRTL